MDIKTKLIHWGIFLYLSVWWWFVCTPILSENTFMGKLLVWVFFFAAGMVVTEEESNG